MEGGVRERSFDGEGLSEVSLEGGVFFWFAFAGDALSSILLGESLQANASS